MAERHYARIRPGLLRWGRESAGLDVATAARKIGVKADRLAEWEAGTRLLTVSQLRRAAQAYKRPLAVFFLPEPPPPPAPIHDFRRLYGEEPPPASPALVLEMRRARRRRAVAVELATELGLPVTPFPLRARLEDDPEAIAAEARRWLDVPLEIQAGWRGEYEALHRWVVVLESRGVLVFQTGDVDLAEMRGFSVSEPEWPAVVLNTKDSPRGRVFTLMHEFAHLMLQESGICDPLRVRRRHRTADERVEVFCNHVAGALLVPGQALLRDPLVVAHGRTPEWDERTLHTLAERFAVSQEVVVRRLLILARTTENFYEQRRAVYQAQYQARAVRQQEREGFAPLPRVVVRDHGRRYTRLVLDALERAYITEADVSEYLGVRLKHLDEIAGVVQESGVEA